MRYASYEPFSPDNDHDHCQFCFVTFMKVPYKDRVLTSGYCSEDRYWWICPECFEAVKDHLRLRVKPP